MVQTALKVGWTAVDTAAGYSSEGPVGRAIAEEVRSSVFVTTKIGDLGYSTVSSAYNYSLEEAYGRLTTLNFDYVDLVLLHWPAPSSPAWNSDLSSDDACTYMQEQWRALEDFYKLGKARAIGVANFCQADFECIFQTATVVPAVNQLQFHVGMGPDPRGVVSYNRAKGITIQGYESLSVVDKHTFIRDNSLITGNFTGDIGRRYGMTGAQVALRWLVQHGIAPVTSSGSEKHLREDLEAFSFVLDDADMQMLDAATTPAGEPNECFPGVPHCGATAFAATV